MARVVAEQRYARTCQSAGAFPADMHAGERGVLIETCEDPGSPRRLRMRGVRERRGRGGSIQTGKTLGNGRAD